MNRTSSESPPQQQGPQPSVPQLVIQPPDDDDIYEDDGTDDLASSEVVDPMQRYFNWANIVGIISALLISGFFIFEPQLMTYFWKVYSPEETSDFLINLKTCKIPRLYDGQSQLPFMWDLDLSRNNLAYVDFDCESVDDFSDIVNERLYVMTKPKRRKCCIRNITRPEILDSDMYRVSNTCQEFTANGTDISGSEFLLVQCIHQKNKSVDFNTHALLPTKPTIVEKVLYWSSKYTQRDDLPYSVAIFVISSTSRAQAYRSLPETMKFLEGSDAQFTTMNGYHSMEDNTPMALSSNNILPLISGMTEPAEAAWKSRWDNSSLLWTKFMNEKYITLFMDDSKKMLKTTHGNANGNGKHKAFRKQPTDYYMKPFLEAHSEATDALFLNRGVAKRYCFGKRTVTSYLLHHLLRFHKKFELIPTFSFSYLSWPQQQYGLESLAKMDHTYLTFFQDFLGLPHISERTAVVVLSDHGAINHPYFKTEHGILEKLNPLLMIKLPQKMTSMHPHYLDNLKVNAHRIVSPVDVHKTLSLFPKMFVEKPPFPTPNGGKTVLTPNSLPTTTTTTVGDPLGKLPGRNLFVSEIPHDRTCEDALIPEEMCLCNRTSPPNYNGRSIISSDGTPEKYWHYVSVSN